VLKSLDGKSVDNAPDVLQTYELCKEFGWLPSQLDAEDSKTIQEMIVVMNAINEHQSKGEKRNKRKEVAGKFGGSQRR
jgi:hypothetical protein